MHKYCYWRELDKAMQKQNSIKPAALDLSVEKYNYRTCAPLNISKIPVSVFLFRFKAVVLILFDFCMVLWWQTREHLYGILYLFLYGTVITSLEEEEAGRRHGCLLVYFLVSGFTHRPLDGKGELRSLIVSHPRNLFIAFPKLQPVGRHYYWAVALINHLILRSDNISQKTCQVFRQTWIYYLR